MQVRVELGERSYDIHIGANLIDKAGEILRPIMPSGRAFVVSDDHVAPIYLQHLTASLDKAGIKHQQTMLAAGENSKDFAHLEALLDAMLEAKVERNTTIIALGGGVIGDITGFAASIVLRGVPFVQIPTTLLAQVDSAVGGKTGINTHQGKNLVGSFYQPLVVISDTHALSTLPQRQIRAGYAEVLKYSLIDNPEFFTWLSANWRDVFTLKPEAIAHAVAVSCLAKAKIVGEDEKESANRALLNLGHTFAHALETEVGYNDALFHGEAVAIGMQLAFEMSRNLGFCPAEDVEKLRHHLDVTGVPYSLAHISRKMNPETLLSHMANDKKVKDGKLTFILASGIGKAFITNQVPADAVLKVLKESALC